MAGFLGTRGDFFSDLLIVALALVVPALVIAIVLALKGRQRAHRAIMLSLIGVLVVYVVIFEANLLLLGGMDYLDRVTTMARGPYYAMVGVHVAIGVGALVLGIWALRRGQKLFRDDSQALRSHTRLGWGGASLLGLAAITGVVVYWATFVA